MRTCPGCGIRRKGTGLQCRRCWLKARAAAGILTLTCSVCGASFTRMRAEQEKATRAGTQGTYCSRRCLGDSKKTGGRPCVRCGQPTGSRDPRRRYCGEVCKTAAQDERRKTKPCPHCGKVFAYSSERQIYCDRLCANAAHSLRMVGTGNSHYKDGTSYAEWFRLIKPMIKERDSFACVACGRIDSPRPITRQGRTVMQTGLRVHHINEVPADNRPENLITLCVTCHGVHHKSTVTPWPWFADYAASATRSMTSRWRATTTSLQAKFSSTTA